MSMTTLSATSAPFSLESAEGKSVAPELVIIICTHERQESLRRCLEHVRAAGNSSRVEVVVCDNRPKSDGTRKLADEFGAKYKVVLNGGKSTALNQTIAESEAEIIGLLDDDDYIFPDWIETLLQLFSERDVQYISGLRLAFGELSVDQSEFEKRGGFSKGIQTKVFSRDFLSEFRFRGVPLYRIGLGGNCGFRRSAFLEVGGYDTLFGPGEAIWAGESTEICYRMLRANFNLMYAPELRSRNLYVEDPREMRLRFFRYGVADTAIHTKIFFEFGEFGSLHEILWSKVFRQLVNAIKSFSVPNRPSFAMSLIEISGNFLGPWIFAFSKTFRKPKHRYVKD